MGHIENMDDLDFEFGDDTECEDDPECIDDDDRPDPADDLEYLFGEMVLKYWFQYFFGLMAAQENMREKNYDMAHRRFQELDELCDRAMRDPEEDDPLEEEWVDYQLLARHLDMEMDGGDFESVNLLIETVFEMLLESCYNDLDKFGFLDPCEWDDDWEDWED